MHLALLKKDKFAPRDGCLPPLSIILLIALPLLVLSNIGDSDSYATSNSSNETINDEPQPGTIVVTKQVINEGGGSARPSDFTITVDGNNPTPASFDGVFLELLSNCLKVDMQLRNLDLLLIMILRYLGDAQVALEQVKAKCVRLPTHILHHLPLLQLVR